MRKALPLLFQTITFLFRKLTIPALILFFLFAFKNTAKAQPPVDPSSIIGKVVCGYQGWFTATGDGSPINRWTHWSITNAPQPGVAPNPNPNLTFDAYPDVSIYNSSSLFPTNLGAHGDGTTSKLFSSQKEDIIDKHFQMMQANGIDGVAFQRFIWEAIVDPAFKANRDTVAARVKRTAEKYSRMYYLVYDLSGLGNMTAANDQERFDAIKADYTNTMLGQLQFTSSPMYAKQGGKPVVQIWGIGYNHIIGSAAIQKDLIDWFKAQGCYVIAGVPTGWRTGTGASNTGWINTYKAANMISPWMVGAFADNAGADNFKTNFLSPDLTFCNSNGMAYQPVMFPGFSWYNWNSGTKNQIPRNKGEFMWHQATNLKSLGITTVEIAMFDEFDEGTAILPMADGYDMIPTNQYFVTTSADGTYLSPDFYLRLASKASKMIKGLEASTVNVAIPYSTSPLQFRTSTEVGYDATPTWVSTTDIKNNVTNYGSTTGNPTCVNQTKSPRRGLYAMEVRGNDRSTSNSNAYFKVFDVDIPVNAYSTLSFYSLPENALGRFVSIDLVMTDGTTLRDAGAVDTNNVSMHPATGRGTVGTWTKTVCKIGTWLSGKTIDKIMLAYDNNPSTGNFSAYFDDIMINETYLVLPVKLLSFSANKSGADAQLQWRTTEEKSVHQYQLERSSDGIHFIKIGTRLPQSGSGNNYYNYTDLNATDYANANGLVFYRLRSVDNDDKATYSSTQIVSFKKATVFIDDVFPNPFKENISMRVNAEKEGTLQAVIIDVQGKICYRNEQHVQKGTTVVTLPKLAKLPAGIYFLKTTLGNNTMTFKIKK